MGKAESETGCKLVSRTSILEANLNPNPSQDVLEMEEDYQYYLNLKQAFQKEKFIPLGEVIEKIPKNSWGVYGIFYTNPRHPAYRKWKSVADKRPIYIGKSSGCVLGRLKEHLRSIDDSEVFKIEDFSVKLIPISSPNKTTYAEAVFIDYCGSPWNGTGFGAGKQGPSRSNQKTSNWDCLYGGRAQSAHTIDTNKEQHSAAKMFFKERLAKFSQPMP